MAETLKEKTAKGLFWGGVSNGVQQVLNLVFGVFLARMLSQSDYGMVGMLTIFSALAGALQEGGFISALNRKKDVSHRDYNAVFWTSVLVSLFCYLLLFLSAPLISDFYGEPELKSLSRYIFLGFFISSLGIAPRAYLFRNMMARENAIISFFCQFLSGVVGLSLAAMGFAYWGIATQTIVYVSIVTTLSFYFSKWRPSFKIDFSPIKEIIGFSSKLIITNIFSVININVFPVILGKLYTPHEVGNYTQANKWKDMGCYVISGMLGGIAQPVFAKTDDDIVRQKMVFRKLLRFTAFVSFPAMFGLALVAKEFIVILLTEKWIESARIMQMLCIAGAFSPISGLFASLIISRGKSTTYMWGCIMSCIVQFLAVFSVANYGINCMIQFYVIINILCLFFWHYFAYKEIGISLSEMIKDISPYLILTTILVIAAALLTENVSNLYVRFIVKVLFVVSLYTFILWMFGSTIFKESLKFISSLRKKRKV